MVYSPDVARMKDGQNYKYRFIITTLCFADFFFISSQILSFDGVSERKMHPKEQDMSIASKMHPKEWDMSITSKSRAERYN